MVAELVVMLFTLMLVIDGAVVSGGTLYSSLSVGLEQPGSFMSMSPSESLSRESEQAVVGVGGGVYPPVPMYGLPWASVLVTSCA